MMMMTTTINSDGAGDDGDDLICILPYTRKGSWG